MDAMGGTLLQDIEHKLGMLLDLIDNDVELDESPPDEMD